MARKNIKLIIEYNGAGYAGWQFQPNRTTLQGELEEAIRRLTGHDVTLYAAGRTDAGVHALGQVANFLIDHDLPLQKYRDGLNFYLPNDILIRSADDAPFTFNARYDAVSRHYQYLVGRERSALYRDMRWEVTAPLNTAMFEQAAAYIMGEHDFTTFCVVSSRKENNRCIVYRSTWTAQGSSLMYEIAANRFLHSMIRSLVGLMVELARGGMTFREFKKIFESGEGRSILRDP